MAKTSLPFPFRYDQSATATPTMTMESQTGGFISAPIGGGGASAISGGESKQAAAVEIGSEDMPTGQKRAIQQVKVMEISPNEAAAALDLKEPYFPKWEWLHMVAFSIRPTHVSSLSEASSDLMRTTNQPQQISENLVLGTAAANTEMLSWETAIKKAAKVYDKLELSLIVFAEFKKHQVQIKDKKIMIPVAHRIAYHFYFSKSDAKTVSDPFIITFDTLSHDRPPKASFQDILLAVKKKVEGMSAVPALPYGIRTELMDDLS